MLACQAADAGRVDMGLPTGEHAADLEWAVGAPTLLEDHRSRRSVSSIRFSIKGLPATLPGSSPLTRLP
jgi:hypothetical protein